MAGGLVSERGQPPSDVVRVFPVELVTEPFGQERQGTKGKARSRTASNHPRSQNSSTLAEASAKPAASEVRWGPSTIVKPAASDDVAAPRVTKLTSSLSGNSTRADSRKAVSQWEWMSAPQFAGTGRSPRQSHTTPRASGTRSAWTNTTVSIRPRLAVGPRRLQSTRKGQTLRHHNEARLQAHGRQRSRMDLGRNHGGGTPLRGKG